MYTNEIIQMLTWPILIILSYQLIKWVIKKYEGKFEEEDSNE